MSSGREEMVELNVNYLQAYGQTGKAPGLCTYRNINNNNNNGYL